MIALIVANQTLLIRNKRNLHAFIATAKMELIVMVNLLKEVGETYHMPIN